MEELLKEVAITVRWMAEVDLKIYGVVRQETIEVAEVQKVDISEYLKIQNS